MKMQGAVLTAFAVVIGVDIGAVGTRRIPYFGYYFDAVPAANHTSEVVGHANISYVDADWQPIHDPSYAATYINGGLYVSLMLGGGWRQPYGRDLFLNANGELYSYLTAKRDALLASGLMSRVVVVQVSEEWFSALRACTIS